MGSRQVRVYVSATADLEAEREVVGEALARFPIPLPWEIRRTPHPGEQSPGALRQVRDSDFCLVLLGQDISAPVGAELEAADRARVPLFALIKDVALTPAGRFFRYNSIEKWERFSSALGLKQLVVNYLADALAKDPTHYGLSLDEIGSLLDFLRKARKGKGDGEGAYARAETVVTGKGPSGAEDAAVIVSPWPRRLCSE